MKKILFFVTIFVMSMIIIPNVYADSCSYYGLIHGDSETCYNYDDFDDAVKAAQDGDVLRMYSVYYPNNLVKIKRDATGAKFTIDFNNHSISKVQFDIEDGSDITFNNLKQFTTSDEGAGIILGKGTLTINGGEIFNNKYTYDSFKYLIQVGNGNDKGHLILKNNVLINSSSVGISVLGKGSILDYESAKINSQNYSVLYGGNDAVINIKGGEMYASAGAGIGNYSGANNGTINISGGTINGGTVYVGGTNSTLNVTGGEINTYGYGIGVNTGTNTKVFIEEGANIKSKYSGIHSFKTAVDTEITINGGTIEGFGTNIPGYGDILSPAIFLENVKKLTINKGELKGHYGVIALQGEVEINGGEIVTIKKEGKMFWSDYNNLYSLNGSGYSVVIDNKTSGYDSVAHATINGGNFLAEGETTLLSYNDKSTDFSVSGGIYNHPFNQEFIIPDKLELKITNNENSLWYVGNDALVAVESAKKDENNVIEVLQGNLNITDAKIGLQVKNSGNGKVTVNEKSVEKGQTIIAEAMPEKPQTNSNTNNEKDSNKEKNPKTKDDIYTWISIISIGIVGLTYTIKKKLFN